MSNYSGETSFEFEIERYKDKESGEMLTLEKVTLDDDTEGFEFEYHVIPLVVEGRSYFQSGRISGPPEDCYPDEGETEIISIIGPDQEDWSHKLTASEQNSILEMVTENVRDGLDFEPDDYYDDQDY